MTRVVLPTAVRGTGRSRWVDAPPAAAESTVPPAVAAVAAESVPPAVAAVAAESTVPPAPAGEPGPTPDEWHAAVSAIRRLGPADPVLLACHVNPDGDALGSMLAMAVALRKQGLGRPYASFPGPPEVPEPFRTLPGLDLLVPADQAPRQPALMLCFDAASAGRLGVLAERISASTIVLDHHASNTRFGGTHLVDPTAAATSVVADQLLDRLGIPLDRDIAECLYVALATDTGSFRFDLTTPAVHEFAARLLRTGIEPAEISRRLFDSRPFGAVRLHADVLSRAQLEPAAAGGRGLVWTYATLDDLARHRQRPYVLEALIDAVRAADEADVACLVKQVDQASWAVSLRSKGALDVGQVAVALGGGGHRLAAGFTGHGSVADVLAAIRRELDARSAEDQG